MSRSRSRSRSHTVVASGNKTYRKYEVLYRSLREAINDYRDIYSGCNVTIGDIREELVTGDSEDILIPLKVSHLPNVGHFEQFLSRKLQATTYLQAELELESTKSVMKFLCHIDRKEFKNRHSVLVQKLRQLTPFVGVLLFLFAYFYFVF